MNLQDTALSVPGVLAETDDEGGEGGEHDDHLDPHEEGEEAGEVLLQPGLDHCQTAVGVDGEGREDAVEDVTAAVGGGLEAAGVRDGVVVTTVLDLPVLEPGVVVQGPATQKLGLLQ